MNPTLTLAGIKFCAMLLGIDQPNYDQCQMAIMNVAMVMDRWYRSPTSNMSMPNPYKKPEGFKECIEWATYDIYDGSKGTSGFCWRPAKYVFDMNTATFKWVLE